MIRHRVLPAIAAALLLAPPALSAAPCATAGTRTERMICANPALRAEGAEIARLYRQAVAKAGAHTAAVIAEQARWLATRDRLCGDLAPADDERARTCLARALPLRRAALAVQAAKPGQPFCDRAAATLAAARGLDGGPPVGDLDEQLIGAGLLTPAPEQELTQAWRDRLPPEATQDAGDQMAVVPFGRAHVAVTALDDAASCTSFSVHWLDTAGNGGPALPPPETRPADKPAYCWSESAGFGLDATDAPVFFAQDSGPSRPMARPTRTDIRIRAVHRDRWGAACRIEATYQTEFRLGDGRCAADAATCKALAEATPRWATALAASPWSIGADHPPGRPDYPALDGLAPYTGPFVPAFLTIPSVKGWTYTGLPNFEEEAPLLHWQSPGGPLILRLSPGMLNWRPGPMILGAWRRKGDTLTPVAAYTINQVRVGVPAVTMAARP
ncbi:hypothetical protein [Nitrospirillum viridazoti]|uniref:Lysozyme inhibitor LprI N-terminal domain-containing protein n=1 Tax=Nitrospirillum viridazoti CBAmc TaxID=1441467 RepID=A0A248JWM2_9PROT|nr:hypothetical protein [Nitrospirillum amazonense]ASG23105.1 hypothetical protein Y958_19835 [Nitrospirillum amazonense CBAmc]TWB38843.1 hypothetical protein FBZ91_106171 [Nitrospirillum amazonense]